MVLVLFYITGTGMHFLFYNMDIIILYIPVLLVHARV